MKEEGLNRLARLNLKSIRTPLTSEETVEHARLQEEYKEDRRLRRIELEDREARGCLTEEESRLLMLMRGCDELQRAVDSKIS